LSSASERSPGVAVDQPDSKAARAAATNSPSMKFWSGAVVVLMRPNAPAHYCSAPSYLASKGTPL